MTFEVPVSRASVDQDVFKYKIGEDTFTVKKAKFLSVGQAEALSGADSVSAALNLFGLPGTKAGDAVRSLDQEQFSALIDAWQEDSKIALGESGASAT